MSEPTIKVPNKSFIRITCHRPQPDKVLENGIRVFYRPAAGRDAKVVLFRENGETVDLTKELGILSLEWSVDGRTGYSRAAFLIDGVELEADAEVDGPACVQHEAQMWKKRALEAEALLKKHGGAKLDDPPFVPESKL